MPEEAVVLILFNRPETTQRVFDAIRAWRPGTLFLIADGPRPDRPDDVTQCAAARAVVESVDWPCDVIRDYAPQNLGLRARVRSGLDRVFDEVDRAIILEDDCIPSSEFFTFCETMLERYADEPSVCGVTGTNTQMGTIRGPASYYFSKYVSVWGWATWKRAWSHYDDTLSFWPTWKDSEAFRAVTGEWLQHSYWRNVIFDRVYRGEYDSWAYRWQGSVWFHAGLTITPNANLVTNVGFGDDATHTTDATMPVAHLPVDHLGPITHPESLKADLQADRHFFDVAHGGRNWRFPRVLHHAPRSFARRLTARGRSPRT